MLIWKHTQDDAQKQIEDNQEPDRLAGCLQFLLIRTTVNSLAANYVPAVVAQAVKVKWWTPERAMSVAGKILEAERRFLMYDALLKTNRLNQEQQEEARILGLEAALAFKDERHRVDTLGALAPQLTEPARTQALEAALEASLALENGLSRAEALVQVQEGSCVKKGGFQPK